MGPGFEIHSVIINSFKIMIQFYHKINLLYIIHFTTAIYYVLSGRHVTVIRDARMLKAQQIFI